MNIEFKKSKQKSKNPLILNNDKSKKRKNAFLFTEICTISKEFCKALKKEEIAECKGKRGPQRKLQLEELITLNYMRFAFHIKDMKGIYNLAKELKIVKKLPSYANFIKGSNRITPIILKFLNYLLPQNVEFKK